jgi:hypothetical protein
VSADPILAKYLPEAPINDSAKKRNQNLPGHGGVYTSINLDLYHYGGNNPLKFLDPDGNEDILIIQIPGKVGRFESKAYVFADGTLNKYNTMSMKLDYNVLGKVLNIDFLVRANFGKPIKTFDNFSTLPDDPVEYGTVASGKMYNYQRNDFGGKEAYLLSDPSMQHGQTPQDPKYGKKDFPGLNPAHLERDPAYIEGSHLHRAYFKSTTGKWGGSEACILQKGFEEAGGMNDYLKNSPTGQSGRVLILRWD